jgi:hypothetical protein
MLVVGIFVALCYDPRKQEPMKPPTAPDNFDGLGPQGQGSPQVIQPAPGEERQRNLNRRNNIARSAEQIRQKAIDTQVNPYPPDSCNLYVGDSIKEGGATADFKLANGHTRLPTAVEWFLGKVPHWRRVGPNDAIEPGDVAVYALPHPGVRRTGDSAIVVRIGNRLYGDHFGDHGFSRDPHFIRGNPTGTYDGVRYFRYTGDK